MITLDFETEAIVGNPLLDPPKPVGLAIRWETGATEYETDMAQMAAKFANAVSKGPVLFHNAYFDLSVARTWLGIPFPHWSNVHDTMYLVYLKDPYAKTYSLKPSAERYLQLPPEEQDIVKLWILKNVPKATEKNWGAHISLCPEEILAPYAIGDVVRTWELYAALAPDVPQEPYDRERRLAPILVRATCNGVRLAVNKLEQAFEQYTAALEQAEQRIRGALGVPGLNLSSAAELAQALDNAGMVEKWALTPTGKRSTSMKTLQILDSEVDCLVRYRSALNTLLGTFITGWLEQQRNGRLHPNWNSTRGDREGGTRTGRLSSSAPNFQNIPNPLDTSVPSGLPELPHMRDFILPEPGHVWLKRDFSAQEIRLAAHFEDGALAKAFNEDPLLDPHNMVRELVRKATGVEYPRKYIKETGFGILYGMGRPALAGRLSITIQEADALMKAYLQALPGMKNLQKGTKERGRSNRPIKTWGGRLIFAEPPSDGRSFEYKLLNYLIQGSAADQTKECIIQWDEHYRHEEDVFTATVHDEANVSAPEEHKKESMEALRAAMEDVCVFDVPMRTEGFIGPSWGEVGDE